MLNTNCCSDFEDIHGYPHVFYCFPMFSPSFLLLDIFSRVPAGPRPAVVALLCLVLYAVFESGEDARPWSEGWKQLDGCEILQLIGGKHPTFWGFNMFQPSFWWCRILQYFATIHSISTWAVMHHLDRRWSRGVLFSKMQWHCFPAPWR